MAGTYRLAALALFSLLMVQPAFADAAPWNWSNYTGTTTWDVTAIEDEGGCGGGVYTYDYSGVIIQFRGGSAVMGDTGHASVGGTFVSPNILHIDSRTVADPPGSSDLSAYDVFFTADCTAFATRYTWDYSGPYQECSGSTRLNGVNSAGCPKPPEPLIPPPPPPSTQLVDGMISSARVDLDRALGLRELMETQQAFVFQHMNDPAYATSVARANIQIANAREELKTLDPKVEAAYAAILVRDPNNFNANWDMAQFKKSEGQIPDFVRYVNNALSDGKTAATKRNDLRHYVAGQMKTADVPTPETSPFVRQAGIDGDAVQRVYGYDIAKQKENKENEGLNLFLFFTSGSLAERAVRQ
ncbi:MAG: hypothetical protein PHV13_05225 [Candidatus ainarchaeum sp.]|nr:hypothetical protein [Candidatus ainarchaeum sp.]